MIPIHEYRQTLIETVELYLHWYTENTKEALYLEIYGNLDQAEAYHQIALAYLNCARTLEHKFTQRTTSCEFIENKIKHMCETQPLEQVVNTLEKQLKKKL